jgi:hypothetical protein
MDTIAAAMITAVVGIIGGFLVGNRYVKYEQLHERQAEVIAKLCELLTALQCDVANLTSPLQPGDVNRLEQAEAVDRVFGALVDHYRSNEVWLAPHTCKKIETFLQKFPFPCRTT